MEQYIIFGHRLWLLVIHRSFEEIWASLAVCSGMYNPVSTSLLWNCLKRLLLRQDGDNINNYVDVMGDTSDPAVVAARERLLSEGGTLTAPERQRLMKY